MLITHKTPKKIFCGNHNIMQSGNSKQDHPGQENYKQPHKVIYHGFVHRIKYILISFLGNLPRLNWWKKCLHMTVQVNIVWFQKKSIPPRRKGFFPTPPHPSGNPSKASYISSYFLIFQNPPSPRKFQSLLWWGGGEYGYFLELHIN